MKRWKACNRYLTKSYNKCLTVSNYRVTYILYLMYAKFLSSSKNVINLKKVTWKKVDRVFTLCGRKPIPFVCIALSELEKNYIKEV